MRLDPGEDGEAELNLTPLIDVVFMLLIFFLVATTFAREEVEMDLSLPEAASGEQGGEVHPIIINVKRSGDLYVDGRPVSLEALRQKLAAAARRSKDQEVLIRGDKQAHYGAVAAVIDACKRVALKSIALGAEPGDN